MVFAPIHYRWEMFLQSVEIVEFFISKSSELAPKRGLKRIQNRGHKMIYKKNGKKSCEITGPKVRPRTRRPGLHTSSLISNLN